MIPTDQSFYKDLLDHMSDGVYFVDRDRKILYWNEGAFRLSGYSSQELLGRSCQDDILCHVDYEERDCARMVVLYRHPSMTERRTRRMCS